jgi:hypothetical protein
VTRLKRTRWPVGATAMCISGGGEGLCDNSESVLEPSSLSSEDELFGTSIRPIASEERPIRGCLIEKWSHAHKRVNTGQQRLCFHPVRYQMLPHAAELCPHKALHGVSIE